MDCFIYFFELLAFLLLSYMFFRLISCLYKKNILKEDDIFYITSNPWEYKRHKNKIKNKEGS